MDKSYSPGEIEARNYQRWENAGWFAPSGDGAPYSIVIPPPNVTGTLHMGHAFQHTLMDALTRLHRMEGRRTLWQPGTDHAGIATQMVVERQLNQQGEHRVALGRTEFVARVWRWKEESGGTIARQMRRLGASVDWSRDRFTMDESLSAAVTEVFVRLAAGFASEIELARDEMAVNGKSIMGVMMLAAECGSQVVVRANGADEEAALAALEDLIRNGFGET